MNQRHCESSVVRRHVIRVLLVRMLLVMMSELNWVRLCHLSLTQLCWLLVLAVPASGVSVCLLCLSVEPLLTFSANQLTYLLT